MILECWKIAVFLYSTVILELFEKYLGPWFEQANKTKAKHPASYVKRLLATISLRGRIEPQYGTSLFHSFTPGVKFCDIIPKG